MNEKRKAQREQEIVQAHKEYIDLVVSYIERAKFCANFLKQAAIVNVAQIMAIEHFIIHAQRQIDQILRRVVKGEGTIVISGQAGRAFRRFYRGAL